MNVHKVADFKSSFACTITVLFDLQFIISHISKNLLINLERVTDLLTYDSLLDVCPHPSQVANPVHAAVVVPRVPKQRPTD